ncbi:MAG: hypothetical protein MJE12_11815 [Alphaproteobacteria bacterium]|nr:hypothetical protein [Alphaproteobacteria bacterium]
MANTEIVTMDARIGTGFHRVDLSRDIEGVPLGVIEAALNWYSVIFFRDQTIMPWKQVLFGEIEIKAFNRCAREGNLKVLVVLNIKKNRYNIGYANACLHLHSDMSYAA